MGIVLSNWKLLLSGLAFIAYVVIQQGLYMALIRACREFKEALDTNTADPKHGTGGFVWLGNVRAMFSKVDGTWVEDSPLPREAVIDSLDNEIWRTSKYGALQRWGLAAPLIGVILSALGFMISPPELTGEVKDIMSKLGPLFVGVFVGALMALVNQIYLHLAAVELGRVRSKAVLWFDENIWKSIRQHAHNALGQATAETQSAAKYLVDSSQQLASCNISYRDSLLELNRQLGLVREAAQATSATFDTFSNTFGEMTEQVRASIRNLTAMNSTAAAVENSSAVWYAAATKVNNASSAIEDSSKKLLGTCENFSSGFETMRLTMKDGLAESTGGLVEVVHKLSEPLTKLEGSIQQMASNTDRHSELSASLTKAVEQSDRFLLERMALNADEADLQQEMAKRIRVSIDSLRQLTDTVGAVGNTGASLNVAATGLREASTTIDSAFKQLFESCNGFSTHCAELQTQMNHGVAEATSGLKSAAQELATPIQSLNTNMSRASTTTGNHADLSDRLEAIAKQAERFFEERAKADAADATRVDRMTGVETRLEETAKVLADSANAMHQLQGGLDALVSELRTSRATENARGRGLFGWLSKPSNTAIVPHNGTKQ